MSRVIVMVLTVVVGVVALSLGGEDWKPDGTKPLPLLEIQAPKKRSLLCATFLPDDRTLLTGGGDGFGPGDLASWAIPAGQCRALYTNHELLIWSVACSPDGKMAATGGGYGEVKLWDVVSGKVLADLDAGSECADSVAFSPDGKLLASGGLDSARIWNVETHKCIADLSDIKPWGHHVLAFSPDGKTLVVEENGGVLRQWDAETWKEKASIKGLYPQLKNGEYGQIIALQYSPDGKLLALAGGYYKPRYDSVKLWDVAAGKVIQEIKGHSGTIHGVVFTPDGKHLITGSFDQTIKIWEVTSGKQITSWVAHKSVIRNLAISHSGELLASCGDDKVVRVWDVAKILGMK